MLDIAPNEKHCEFYLKGENLFLVALALGTLAAAAAAR